MAIYKTEQEAARHVVERLRERGYEALYAGGCVRDKLLGRPVSDYDVATSAKPEEVERVFRRTRAVGAQFGVILVRFGPFQIEVATFRTDGDYSDGRRPDSVSFSTAEEDAQRRDFTINGLFYDPIEDQIIDYVGGKDDLLKGVVRAIGEPEKRILEDHLRLLRAVRFAARLGFRIEAKTQEVMEREAKKIKDVSAERVFEELSKILKNKNRARGVRLLLDLGLIEQLDMSLHVKLQHRRDTLLKMLELLPSMSTAPVLWACFFGDADYAGRLLRDLKSSNELRQRTVEILEVLDSYQNYSSLSLSERKRLLRREQQAEHLEFFRIHTLASSGQVSKLTEICHDLEAYGPSGDGSLYASRIITGDDLKGLGLQAGPVFSKILKASEDKQLEGFTDKLKLVNWVKDQFKDEF